jgi:hypothetical protein
MSRIPMTFVLAALLAGSPVAAQRLENAPPTLSTSYANVTVTEVPLGTDVSLTDPQGRGLVLRNGTSERITVAARLQVPRAEALPVGVEPLPDPAWITLRPSSLRIAAETEQEIEIQLRVPPHRKYRGKRYSFQILTAVLPRDGATVEVSPALLSRVMFSVSSR